MRKKVREGAVLAVGGLAVARLVLGTGTAKADVYGSRGDHDGAMFAAEMAVDGEYETPYQATSLAMYICGLRASGLSEVTLRYAMEVKYSINLSVDAVVGAEWHFCPAYVAPADPPLPPPPPPPPPSDGISPVGLF